MNFESTSLLLSWTELGALLSILFRLGYTLGLIANTQRELRRTIDRLGKPRSTHNSFAGPEVAPVSTSPYSRVNADDLVYLPL